MPPAHTLGFNHAINAVIVGGNVGIGGAFVSRLLQTPGCTVWATSRDPSNLPPQSHFTSQLDLTKEDTIAATAQQMREHDFAPNLVMNCMGILHTKVGDKLL